MVAIAGLAGVAGVTAMPGCGSSPKATPEPRIETTASVPAAPLSAIEQLVARASRELDAPVPLDATTTLPPGVDPQAVAPLPIEQVLPSTKTGRPLTDTINELESTWKKPGMPPVESGPAPSDEDLLDAVTNYAQARLMLLNQDPGKAIPLLQAATRLDPTSPALWRELGQSHLAMNRRAPGIAALKQAQRLGDDDAALCYLLGRDAARSGLTGEALSLLAHALTGAAPTDDQALTFLITAELADVLLADGRIRAARDAQIASLDLPETWDVETGFRAELADLFRRRFDLWTRAGDLSCRLGDASIAAQAYDRAAKMPALDPGMVLPRQVLACLRAGRNARAALLVLNAIDKSDGRLEDRHAELVRFLSTTTDLGPTLALALAELSQSLKERATPSVLARLARVEAGALAPGAAQHTLLRSALANPWDLESVAYLVESFQPADVAGLSATLGALARAAPNHSWTYADALLSCGRGVEEALAALADRPEPSVRLIEAAILARTGRLNEAAARLERISASILEPSLRAAWLAMRTDVAFARADQQTADASLNELNALSKTDNSPGVLIASAMAQRSARRFSDASSAALAAITSPTDVFPRILAADSALRRGDGETTRDSLLDALGADRYSESVYEALLALYTAAGPLPDASKFADAARQLRQAIPGGRLLRILTARDMLARDMLRDAEPILVELARQSPPDSRAIELLADFAARAFKTDAIAARRAEALLRGLLVDRPDSPAVLAAAARAMAATGKGKEGVDLLAKRLSYWPMPELARVREGLVRDALNDAPRANELARTRLEQAPRTLNNATELAELLTQLEDIEGAARVLGEALAAGASLSPEQSKAVLAILTRLPAQLESNADARGALALFDHVEAQKLAITAPLLIKRVRYAAQAFADEPARSFDIAAAAILAAPELADAAYDIGFQHHLSTNRTDRAIALAEQVATRAQPWKPIYTQAWLVFIARGGSVENAKTLIDSTARQNHLVEFASLVGDRLRLDQTDPPGDGELRAEIAYGLAGLMLSAEREPEAISVYRLSLELAPSYNIIANDLGYLLLERGESLDEASALIEKAYAGLTDNPNVIDSLGWLRYKQGVFNDEVDDSGAVIREGAVTLLQRAVNLAEEIVPNDAGNEHLGDAFWRAGKQTEALRAWRTSANYRQQLLDFYKSRTEDPAQFKAITESLALLRTKIEVGSAGGAPAVAPIWPANPPAK